MKKDYRGSFEYNKWKFGVFMRDNYICQCCGSSDNPEAHHIRNYKTNKDLRLDINNGITLCKECHNVYVKNSFHYVYGTFNNDEIQLKEYIENKRSGFFNKSKSKIVESEWVTEQKEILRENTYYICSEEFKIEFPYLSKLIETKTMTLKLLISDCKKVIKEEIRYQDLPLLLVKSHNNIGQSLMLFTRLNLIVKVEAGELTKEQLHKVEMVKEKYKYCYPVDFYQIPEYGCISLKQSEKIARSLLLKNSDNSFRAKYNPPDYRKISCKKFGNEYEPCGICYDCLHDNPYQHEMCHDECWKDLLINQVSEEDAIKYINNSKKARYQ